MANNLHQAQSHEVLRSWQCQRNDINHHMDFVLPLFIGNTDNLVEPIGSMPDVYRYGVDKAIEYLEPLVYSFGLRAVLLFPVVTKPEPESKPDFEEIEKPQVDVKEREPSPSETISSTKSQDIKLIKNLALSDQHNPVLRLIPKLRSWFPDLLIMCDVCLCAFTSTGHCCLFDDHRTLSDNKSHGLPIANKVTCQYLAALALAYARKGCNVIAPSDMMDGRIQAIREKLDVEGMTQISIMSYSAKFASAFYGPFRQATNNTPEFGDRQSYQLPAGSRAMAMRAVQRDVEQGADFIMVKPGGAYLDIIRDIREAYPTTPIAVYQVSGEYAMLKMAADAQILDLKKGVNESMTAFRRAGANIIISYFTPQILKGEI